MRKLIFAMLLAPIAVLSVIGNPLQDHEWQVRRAAVAALTTEDLEDKSVATALLARLQDEDSRVRRAAALKVDELNLRNRDVLKGLVPLLSDNDPSVRQTAANTLGHFGAKAKIATKALSINLTHEEARVRQSAATALGRIGGARPDTVERLISATEDSDASVRAAAAEALAAYGKAGLESLIKCLADHQVTVRETAAASLGVIGKPAIGPTMESLKSGNPVVLKSTVTALTAIGEPVADELIEALRDAELPLLTRQYAALALGKIGRKDREVLPALTKALNHEKPAIQQAAARALASMGADAAPAIVGLIQVLRDLDREPLARRYAAEALGKCGVDSDAAVAALVETLKDQNPVIQKSAVQALEAIQAKSAGHPDIATAVTLHLESLENADPKKRRAAAEQLGRLGSEAVAAVAALIERAEKPDEVAEVRVAAVNALGLIGPKARLAVPSLIELLKTNDHDLGSAALTAMKRIGPQPRAIVPRLFSSLKDEDLETRDGAGLQVQQFAETRIEPWRPMVARTRAVVLRHWLARHEALYGVKNLNNLVEGQRDDRNTTSLFDVLGGRAALQETLQLQQIQGNLERNASRTIPVDRIDSVEVKSHPFEDMLKNDEQPDQRLPLAEVVPADRFFAFFSKPETLFSFFKGGKEIFSRLGPVFANQEFNYDLNDRYFGALDIDTANMLALLGSDAVKEVGLVLPDLFLVDGTEITVLIHCKSEDQVTNALKALGVSKPPDDTIAKRTTEDGRTVYRAVRDNFVLISTHLPELEAVLKLHRTKGRGSLGQSDEFRYMLRQLPVLENTQCYFYFSDPFIRRQVGPIIKIGQLRRVQERNDLERLTSAALLYKLDGHPGAPSVEKLRHLGYVPRAIDSKVFHLSESLIPVSKGYGTLADMHSLLDHPIDRVTQKEADAYRNYASTYAQFWRQYFDPIALRLDEVGDRQKEVTTFILPLLENSIYNRLKEIVPKAGNHGVMKTPILSPAPVALFSMKLNDASRIDFSREVTKMFSEYTSVDPTIFDSLGPAVHLAINDSNPIVALGSGNFLRGFRGRSASGFTDLFELPMLVSFLTQPCQVFIELQDQEPVKRLLEEAEAHRSLGSEQGELYRLQGRDAWIYNAEVFDVLKLSLGIEIKNGYLAISNVPWSQQTEIKGVTEAALNGAQLELDYTAVIKQLPALQVAAYSDYRTVSSEGMSELYPLLASGAAEGVEEARDLHTRLFGYAPAHPVAGEWSWRQGELSSSLFGTISKPSQPAHNSGDRDFGVFQGLEGMRVSMQLEDAGLRATIRWKKTNRKKETVP